LKVISPLCLGLLDLITKRKDYERAKNVF